MRDIFVSATNTNVGKTYATLYLMELYAKKGFKVGAYKPIETGVVQTPLDGKKLYEKACELNDNFRALSLDDIVTYRFTLPASPYVAKEKEIDLELIKSEYKRLKNYCDVLFIEGAGGLFVPIEKDFFMIDLANFLNLHTVLITPSRLGCINDTLLSLEALKNRGNSHEWYVNLHEDKDDFYKVTAPFYEDYFGEFRLLKENDKR